MTNKLILRLTCSGMFAFLCLLLIKGEICHALDPQIYPSGLTPTEAQTKCGASGLVHDPLVWIKKSELCGREVWTCQGIFTQLSPWIEIVGCFFLRKQPTRVFKRSSPGYCEQACSTEYFGLSGKDSCICFDIKYIQFNSTLNISSCKTSNDEAVLLYKVYNGTIKRYKTEHGLCSTLTCTKPDVLDEVPCTADPGIQSLCENGMRSSLVQYWSFSQNQSFTNCSNQNRLLLNSSACQYFAHNLTVPAWTNVFREEIEVEKTIDQRECFESRTLVITKILTVKIFNKQHMKALTIQMKRV
ncbi:uncharacterized protein LOC143054239 isoform X2 [Mytilus galloprovincialis]|uniref:uncharacterized protein LOC143054239 isoform X2 n=1 Tax=Mytilus galloprovincialis TaxID=29158 RepID=UPI003F7C2A6A